MDLCVHTCMYALSVKRKIGVRSAFLLEMYISILYNNIFWKIIDLATQKKTRRTVKDKMTAPRTFFFNFLMKKKMQFTAKGYIKENTHKICMGSFDLPLVV